MIDGWIAAEQVFDGQTLRADCGVRLEDGHVAEVGQAPPEATVVSGCLSVGFVDLQVNGGGGVMVNSDPTPDGLRAVARAHHAFGTVALMPTVITDAPAVLDRAAEAAMAVAGSTGIIGLHIEGPHIATAKRGTHAAEHIRPLDARTMDVVGKLRRAGVPVMITLAPEAATLGQIATLAQMGAMVSIGHTGARAEDVTAAIRAGATCGTHLYNAMSQMQGRAPGAVGALLNSQARFGIICDGHHVDDAMIALALRAAGADRAFLVSDAMATVGGGDSFDLYGQTIRVDGGRLVNSDGNLAGAHITQAQGLRRLVQKVGVPLEDALRMAITTPAAVMGQGHLSQMVGRPVAKLIVLNAGLTVRALA
ncbi:N-acetylglucosamine-6-phosphate deacetylase [Pseudooctadecabacter sp.]|uniref:N-acetylglucosamine-6-phosphate deacetylase n=1 Tax=Pseudooctadecabacter sp. TaxID=1966338 RepID=UPI0035C7A6C7